MSAVFLSAILFGLVHPGSKLILGYGLTLVTFCLLYIGIRLLIQIPIVLTTGEWRVSTRQQMVTLSALGLIGATLQFTEFYGISDGLPVSIVSFLVYTHPVWTLLLSRLINKEAFTKIGFIKIFISVAGVYLITGAKSLDGISFHQLLLPLAAGMTIAFWITVSNRATREGSSTRAISFYYDLVAFIALGALSLKSTGTAGFYEAAQFMSDWRHALVMCAYSVFIGLAPNLLFYFGSKNISAMTAGLILLLEPVVATVVAVLVWGEVLSPLFIVGAICILSTNIPADVLIAGRDKLMGLRKSTPRQLSWILVALVSVVMSLPAPWAQAAQLSPTVFAVEIVPADSSHYTVSAETAEMREAFNAAFTEYKKINKTCRPKLEITVQRGKESEIYDLVKRLSTTGVAPVIVGFSRSTFARVAAKASAGSPARGIAIGASTMNLRELNPSFVSVASPRARQWQALAGAMADEPKCASANTLGVFNSKDHLSSQFKADYLNAGYAANEEASPELASTLAKKSNTKTCLFLAFNFSEAQVYLDRLLQQKWEGHVLGVGDWNMYSEEMRKLLAAANHKGITVLVPTGWKPDLNDRSAKFARLMQKQVGKDPSPIGAYTYDATLVALDTACQNFDYKNPLNPMAKNLPLLRQYEGVADSGNYLSKMLIVRLQSGSL